MQEYYRFIPESEVLELLENSTVRVPKLLFKNDTYTAQEYIEGEVLSDICPDNTKVDKSIINQIIDQICLISEIDASRLEKYMKWTDNRSFYKFQLENTEKVFSGYYEKLYEIYDKLNITKDIVSNLYSKMLKIDNDRKLSMIHGDRHKRNIVLSQNTPVFIDWELACIGDLAYEIAFHLHQMAYTKSDEKYFMSTFAKRYRGNIKSLVKDIEVYRLFVLLRSTLYNVNSTYLEYRKKKPLEMRAQLKHFMRRYNDLSKYKELNLKPKKEEELNSIFEEYTESINE